MVHTAFLAFLLSLFFGCRVNPVRRYRTVGASASFLLVQGSPRLQALACRGICRSLHRLCTCVSSDRLGGSLYSQVLPWYGACLSSDRLGGSLYSQAFHGYQQQASDRLGGSLSCCFHVDLASDRLGGSLPCHVIIISCFLLSSFFLLSCLSLLIFSLIEPLRAL